MEDDRIKALVSMLGQHLRREFAVASSSLPPAIREQLEQLQCLAAADRVDKAHPVPFGSAAGPEDL
jgi:hypothetical protein